MESYKNIESREAVNFNRKKMQIWIGSLNEKITVWIGRTDGKSSVWSEKEDDVVPLVEYQHDFTNRNLAVQYIVETLKKLSEKNQSLENLKPEDIDAIKNIFEKGGDKVDTKDILI